MDNPMFQIRDFGNGTWSVIARIWNPQKKFYEHPQHINLSLDEAEKRCRELIKKPVSIDEIVNNWTYIGD